MNLKKFMLDVVWKCCPIRAAELRRSAGGHLFTVRALQEVGLARGTHGR